MAKTPEEAAKLGHAYLYRSDWKQIKYDVMRRAVLCKFQTHADIRKIMLNTGDKIIIQKDIGDYGAMVKMAVARIIWVKF